MVFREMPEKTSSGASLLPYIPPYNLTPDPQLLPNLSISHVKSDL